MNTAIVLDGQLKSALAAVRSLGQAGVPVVAGAVLPQAMALHSRYTAETFVYPNPKEDRELFVAAVIARARAITAATGLPPVVYAFSDTTIVALEAVRSEWEGVFLLPLPSHASFERAFDKRATNELARTLNVPTIESLSLEDRNHTTYPVVLKPTHSIVYKEQGVAGGTAEFVWSPGELMERYETIKVSTGQSPLVQPLIIGEEYGVELVCQKGQVLQSFIHRRVRSLSPRGGAAVVKETAATSPETDLMTQYALTLVDSLDWTGPVMVEFKLSANGVKLMEINGRFWGSLPLPEQAGVPFVLSYYALATGEQQVEAAALPSLRTRHFLGEVKWLLGVWFNRDPMRSRLYPSRLSALKEFFIEPFISQSDVFSWRDPLPALFEVIAILKR